MLSAVGFSAIRTTWRCVLLARAFKLPPVPGAVLVALWLLEGLADELEADQLLELVSELSTLILAWWLQERP
jgi:hypothetical protein